MQETPETQVQSLGREDPLEEKMATYSSFLAWRIPWTEKPVHRVVESDTTELAHTTLSTSPRRYPETASGSSVCLDHCCLLQSVNNRDPETTSDLIQQTTNALAVS